MDSVNPGQEILDDIKQQAEQHREGKPANSTLLSMLCQFLPIPTLTLPPCLSFSFDFLDDDCDLEL